MGVKIDLSVRSNFDIFQQAWRETIIPKYGDNVVTIKDEQRIFHQEFAVRLIYEERKYTYTFAIFDNDEDYTLFMLKFG